jgi:ArsR family metal-binding transcriptional regulator
MGTTPVPAIMSPDNDCFPIGETRPTSYNNKYIPGSTIDESFKTDLESTSEKPRLQITQFSKLLICLGDQSKFRMVARLHPAPGKMVETLKSQFEKAVYSQRLNATLIKIQNTIITIYASGIVTMTRLGDANQARELLNDVISQINKSYDEDLKLLRSEGKSKMNLDPMELAFHLPRTNCTQCGVKSCFYFSTQLAYSEVTLDKCKPLQEEHYIGNREALERIINSGLR